jgi:hypothetical protein
MHVTLPTPVLRGVSVQRDGQTIGLRLVCKAGVGAPAVLVSMRHPSRGERQAGNEPAGRPDYAVSDRVDRDASGAGRSLRGAGALRGESLASSARGPRTATGATAKARALPPTGFITRLGRKRYAAKAPAWCQPAGRTPRASTRGKAAR